MRLHNKSASVDNRRPISRRFARLPRNSSKMPPSSPQGITKLHFVLLGEGDVFAMKGVARCCVIDSGSRGFGKSHVFASVTITHPDQDHCAGLSTFLNGAANAPRRNNKVAKKNPYETRKRPATVESLQQSHEQSASPDTEQSGGSGDGGDEGGGGSGSGGGSGAGDDCGGEGDGEDDPPPPPRRHARRGGWQRLISCVKFLFCLPLWILDFCRPRLPGLWDLIEFTITDDNLRRLFAPAKITLLKRYKEAQQRFHSLASCRWTTFVLLAETLRLLTVCLGHRLKRWLWHFLPWLLFIASAVWRSGQ